MKNKTKRVLWGFFLLDYKAMETYLEEMAEKGWMLEKIGLYIALLGPVAGTIIGSGIRYLIKKNKIKEDNSILFTVITIFVVIFFMSK